MVPKGPPRLIEEILYGRSAVVGLRRAAARRGAGGGETTEMRAGDARLINNVGAIFIRQEEATSLPTVAGSETREIAAGDIIPLAGHFSLPLPHLPAADLIPRRFRFLCDQESGAIN